MVHDKTRIQNGVGIQNHEHTNLCKLIPQIQIRIGCLFPPHTPLQLQILSDFIIESMRCHDFQSPPSSILLTGITRLTAHNWQK